MSDNEEASLIDSFNSSAADYLRGGITPGIFGNKYQALAKYKAGSDETKQKLTAILFNTIEREIRTVATPTGRADLQSSDPVQKISPLLQILGSPEAQLFIPERAPGVFADLAVSLADRVGKVTLTDVYQKEQFYLNDYRAKTTALSALIIQYADFFAQAIEHRNDAAKPSAASSEPRKFIQ